MTRRIPGHLINKLYAEIKTISYFTIRLSLIYHLIHWLLRFGKIIKKAKYIELQDKTSNTKRIRGKILMFSVGSFQYELFKNVPFLYTLYAADGAKALPMVQ